DGPVYWPLWAFSRAEEKVAFERWMDWSTARLEHHSDLHVFHYNSYETVALKNLVARHGTREHELDELLRRKVFVDLYGITRQALRAGVEGYGLKPMEAVHGFERAVPLGSMKRWQNYQADGGQEHLDGLAGYNREDCESTLELYAWLLARRPQAEAEFGIELSSLQPEPAHEPSEAELERRAREEALRARLLEGLPDDETEDDEHQRALRVTADLITYHRQEAKPGWWEFFDRRLKSLDQLRDEDRDAIGDLTVLSCEQDKRSLMWTLTYPTQEHKLGVGDIDEPLAECGVKLLTLDEAERRVVVRCGPKFGTEPPLALAPGTPYRTPEQQAALFRFAERVADAGLKPCGILDAGADLLTRRAPRFLPGTPPLSADPFDLDRLKAQVLGLDHTALVIRGPPGTGKTHNGARAALHLIDQGMKVGVMATSHKAINNLVEAIGEAADEARTSFVGWKKCGDKEHGCACGHVISADSRPDPEEHGELDLIAATAWYWSREENHEAVDVLFIDEAGQVSLADAIAVSQAAKSVVLLGDPQQLAHVSQGTHAHGSGVSVLQHLLGDADTVPPDRGVFLPTSWRMHPAITGFISDTMYEGRVTSVPGCEGQHVTSAGLSGSGLRMLEVDHADNRGSSTEEADAIAAEVELLLTDGRHVDRDGVEKPLTLDDILIVAPYNAQVRCLRATLPDGARVGTVDKFQGQEAPVVFFSMASSSGDDVSRGMSFLFSRNRLNVAVSRAQCLAVVVCSPRLLGARCSSVEDMRLVNMLCRFAGAAGVTDPSASTFGNL
nr:AAA family ATPase [Solirubrobacterales bacterium]